MNRTDIILSCFLRLISIFSILLFIQTLVGLGEFEATVGAQVSMSIENCPLTPSIPEGFEEAKGPGEGVGRSILVEPQQNVMESLIRLCDIPMIPTYLYSVSSCPHSVFNWRRLIPPPFPPENHVIPAKFSVPPAPWLVTHEPTISDKVVDTLTFSTPDYFNFISFALFE